MLQKNIQIIDADTRLHKYVVTHELESGKRENNRNQLDFDDEVLAFMSANPSEIICIFRYETNDENQSRCRTKTAQNRILKR